MQNNDQRRSATSKTTLIGDSQIPAALGQTITGALANIPFPFGIDSDGNYGYKKAGADAVTPFSEGEGGYACITTGYDTYAYPIGEDYNPAVFSRNSAANYTSNIDGDMYVIFTSFCMTQVSFSGSVSVNNTVVYTAPNGSQVSPQLSSAIPIHKGDVISIRGGTSAHHNSYFTTLYVKDASSIVYPQLPTTSYVIPYGGNNISISPKYGSIVAIACSAIAVPSAGGTSANIDITSTGLTGVINEFSNISGTMSGMKIELLLGIASSSTVTFNMTSNYNHVGVIYYTPAS